MFSNVMIYFCCIIRKEGNVVINHALNTILFDLWSYDAKIREYSGPMPMASDFPTQATK